MHYAISLTAVLSLLMCINALKADPESGFYRRSDHSDDSEQFNNNPEEAQAVTFKERDDRIIVVCVVVLIVCVGAFTMIVWALYERHNARSYKNPGDMGETQTMLHMSRAQRKTVLATLYIGEPSMIPNKHNAFIV